MVGWIILAIIAALIIAICLIRIGVAASYVSQQFSLSVKAAGLEIQLLPKKETDGRKEAKKKKTKKEKPQETSPEEKKEKKKGLPFGFSKKELFDLARDLLVRIGRFPKKIQVDKFLLHLLVAGKDPYQTAKNYGLINEALSTLLPLAKNSFRVKRSSVRTEIDFIRDEMEIEAALSLSIRIGQVLALVFSLVFCALRAWIKSKRRQKNEARARKKQAVNDPEALADGEKTENNQQIEERMVANG